MLSLVYQVILGARSSSRRPGVNVKIIYLVKTCKYLTAFDNCHKVLWYITERKLILTIIIRRVILYWLIYKYVNFHFMLKLFAIRLGTATIICLSS